MPRAAFIDKVRLWLRDDPRNNALTRGVETGSEMIDYAIDLAIERYNSIPPLIGDKTYESFPSLTLLHLGTVIEVLESASIMQMRNQLTFSDGGFTIRTSDKAPEYMKFIQWLQQKYRAELLRYKRAVNAESCYSSASSEYVSAAVHTFFGRSLTDISVGFSVVF